MSAAAIERGKRALALAIAQDEAEGKRLESTQWPHRRPRGAGGRGARRRARGSGRRGRPRRSRSWRPTATRSARRAPTYGGEIARLRDGVTGAGAPADRARARTPDRPGGRGGAPAAQAGPADMAGAATLAEAEATLAAPARAAGRGGRDRRGIARRSTAKRRRSYVAEQARSRRLRQADPDRPPNRARAAAPAQARRAGRRPANRPPERVTASLTATVIGALS